MSVLVDIDATPPGAPVSLTALAVSSSSVHLSWSASTDNVGVAGYHCFRGTITIATVNTDVTSYSDTGLLPKTQYRYTVSAFDATGNESNPSLERIVTTSHPPLVPPTGTIFNVTAQSAEVRWTLVPDASRYTVAASLSKEGGSFAFQQEATGSENALTGLTPNTTYFLFVNACDESQCTDFALVNSVVTHANVPGLAVAFVRGRDVQLTITPNGNPEGTVYRVELSRADGPFGPGTAGTNLSPVIGGLTPGDQYRFRVFAQNRAGVLTAPSNEAISTLAPAIVDGARAYPSPFRPGLGVVGITFDRLPEDTPVRIFTVDGRSVKTLTTTSTGDAFWDLTTEDNTPVASGVYLAIMEKNGGRKKLKVVVQK